MNINPFDFTAHVVSLMAEGPPHRRLVLSVKLENPWEEAVALLSGWTDVRFDPLGLVVASGYLFKQLHARVAPAVVRRGEPMLGEFQIPMSVSAIDAIERTRSDGVTFQVMVRFLIAPVQESGENSLMRGPREAGIRTVNNDTLGVVVPKSDWIRYLSVWRWSEIELFELPFDRMRESPRFRRAFELLRTADENLRSGDYGGVLVNCRLAIESLAKDSAPQSDVKEGFRLALEQSVRGTEMRSRMNEVIVGLSEVTHLARHEKRPHEDLVRADAVFCLRCTLAVVARLIEPTR